MNELEKRRIKTRMKYTWPFYLMSAVLLAFLMHIIFGIIHRTPAYKTLTLFVSGELVDDQKLTDDMLNKYQSYDIKQFSCIAANPELGEYRSKLTVAGFNSADVFIIHQSKLEDLEMSLFAFNINDELINSMYNGFSLYTQNNINYGIKLDKEKVKDYMSLPNEDCYLLLNAKSSNLGIYSKDQVKEHDMALNLLKEWGI